MYIQVYKGEAVHAIKDVQDLKRRVDEDRRVYAFFHKYIMLTSYVVFEAYLSSLLYGSAFCVFFFVSFLFWCRSMPHTPLTVVHVALTEDISDNVQVNFRFSIILIEIEQMLTCIVLFLYFQY